MPGSRVSVFSMSEMTDTRNGMSSLRSAAAR
jgi:hypothetical protein